MRKLAGSAQDNCQAVSSLDEAKPRMTSLKRDSSAFTERKKGETPFSEVDSSMLPARDLLTNKGLTQ